MNKKNVLIVFVGIIVLAAVVIGIFVLNPMQKAQTQASPAYNNAWKLECIQGRWTSKDERYSLDVDGYDFTLQINGVYAMVASTQFDASEKQHEDSTYFTLLIDPSSVIYPDVQGAEYCEIASLWYEDGMIYMRLSDADDADNTLISFLQVTASPQTSWPFS